MRNVKMNTEELVERLCSLAFDDTRNSEISLIDFDKDISNVRAASEVYVDGNDSKVYAVHDDCEVALHIAAEQLEMAVA